MRDEQKLLQLRPELQLPTLQSGVEEQFQNQTLRPILKMQHPLLASLMLTQIQRYKGTFFHLSKPDRLEWIAHTLRVTNHQKCTTSLHQKCTTLQIKIRQCC